MRLLCSRRSFVFFNAHLIDAQVTSALGVEAHLMSHLDSKSSPEASNFSVTPKTRFAVSRSIVSLERALSFRRGSLCDPFFSSETENAVDDRRIVDGCIKALISITRVVHGVEKAHGVVQ
mgnify:CR=1 FL=1